MDFHYERDLFKVHNGALIDPQTPIPPGATDCANHHVTHTSILAVDDFGNVLQSAAIGYGRRFKDPSLTNGDKDKQAGVLATWTENTYTKTSSPGRVIIAHPWCARHARTS